MTIRATSKRLLLGAAGAAIMLGSPVSAQINSAAPTALQSFPRLPKLPSIPTSIGGNSSERPATNNRELEREFDKDMGMLGYGISTNWSSKADNVRIEQAVAEYRERVERVSGDRYSGVSRSRRQMANSSLRSKYDTIANTAEREIAWAVQKIGKIGVADSAYNDMLVLDTMLHGAVTLYPDVAAYQTAKRSAAAALAKFGSRSGANEQKEALALAEARKVRMPASIDNSSSSVRQFRQAWATGGIPGTIKKIHITSGWGTKRNALGVVIGRTRDAAIAVKDPATGRCNLYDFTMIIETGGSPRRSSHSTKRIACENIPQ